MKTVEFHLLQNFPPSNLNRDDTGAPKDCDFGGYRRQRISSQCLKRSVRRSDNFRENLEGRLGIRTKRALELVARQLMDSGLAAAEASVLAEGFFATLCNGLDAKGETSYLLYVGPEEITRVTDILVQHQESLRPALEKITELRQKLQQVKDQKDEKKKLEEAIGKELKAFDPLAKQYEKEYPRYVRAVDIALFGRMLADRPQENVDAGCQVAHAFSVNKMAMEFDYFTAMDDIKEQQNDPGAGMIGTVNFASSCFYRYATIDILQFVRNLGGDAATALEGIMAFAEGFIEARPSGKQNSFAAHTLPSLVLVVIRDKGQPCSLANAFEKPVEPSAGSSLSQEAAARLLEELSKLTSMYGLSGQAFVVSRDPLGAAPQEATQLASVPELLGAVRKALQV